MYDLICPGFILSSYLFHPRQPIVDFPLKRKEARYMYNEIDEFSFQTFGFVFWEWGKFGRLLKHNYKI